MSEKNTGRVTIPTNLDVVPETIAKSCKTQCEFYSFYINVC